jgi:DtxR family Mn-dependent transcriptional regulator
MEKLTFVMENYLEAIYELSEDGKGVKMTHIAKKLGVTKASTNSAMTTLAEKGLITNERYKKIFLTPLGLEIARFTYKKHHIIKDFFTKILNIDSSIADEDACAIEHVISSDSVCAMENFLSVHENKK